MGLLPHLFVAVIVTVAAGLFVRFVYRIPPERKDRTARASHLSALWLALVLAIPLFGLWAWAFGVTGDYAVGHGPNDVGRLRRFPPIIEPK
jgi:hypothetical protein